MRARVRGRSLDRSDGMRRRREGKSLGYKLFQFGLQLGVRNEQMDTTQVTTTYLKGKHHKR